MEDGIEDIFAEELSGSDDTDSLVEDEVVDNPDDGADDFEDQPELEDEDDIEDDDADTDDEPPADDDDDFDWNEIVERYGDRTVQLTVNGEIVEKPLKDLPSMAMMREDYSRKTAEIASKAKAAQWAEDIQASFDRDPVGTLEAFARAYNISLDSNQAPDVPETDPYEDFDPEVAQVLRQRDQLLLQQQQQLEALTTQYQTIEHQRLMADVKAEVGALKQEFGEDLDHIEMLRIAAEYNMPLREAAETLVGRQAYQKSKEQLKLEADAARVGSRKADDARKTAKKRASGTATKKFSASDVSVDDFSDIGELFEITANSMTT